MISKAKYVASFDLIMGYHQAEIDSKDRAKTAFLTHRGLYVYNVMFFGLCNVPATFQRLMERVLVPLIGKSILVYLDDILIYAETTDKLIEILDEVLKLLAKSGLKCKATKCSFLRSVCTSSVVWSAQKTSTPTHLNSRKSSIGQNQKEARA